MITVVGLGTSSKDDLSNKAIKCLEEATHLVTTASWHQVWSELPTCKLEIWDNWSLEKRLTTLKNCVDNLVLAVAGDPKLDELYLQDIPELAVIGASSRIHSLALPKEWQYVSKDKLKGKTEKSLLARIYPGDWSQVKRNLDKELEVWYEDQGRVGHGEVGKLDLTDGYILVKTNLPERPIDTLLKVMQRLRAPDGCPWDKIQTFTSLKPYLVEEAYELWDAIDSGVTELMIEELGDVLLQVIFHSEIASEAGLFDFEEVALSIAEKLVHRHPHVFGDVKADTPEKVLVNWDAIKKEEKGKEDRLSILDGVPKYLPGLSKANKVQKKAAKVGFDWSEIGPVWDKVTEELQELKEAPSGPRQEEELGDLLFAIVNLARFLHIDPEVAINKTIAKFQKRFRYIENHAPKPLEEMTLEEMDVYWEAAKKEE